MNVKLVRFHTLTFHKISQNICPHSSYCTASVPYISFMECESHLRFIDEQVSRLSKSIGLHQDRLHLGRARPDCTLLVRFPNPLATGHSWQLGNLTTPLRTQLLFFRLNAALANCSLGRIGVVTGAFPGFLLILHLSTFCISNYPFSTSSLSLC